jgi:hypothetical protein
MTCFSQAQLEAIAAALGDTSDGLKGTEIAHLLATCSIGDVDPTLTKRHRLYKAFGHLEKLISLPIADSPGVNVYESEREQTGIIRRQSCGARSVAAIFRGALLSKSRISVRVARAFWGSFAIQ